MQVQFVAEIEESYPRFITRRVYHPSLVVKPNRPTRWKRCVNLSGSKSHRHREENCTSYILHSVYTRNKIHEKLLDSDWLRAVQV